MMARDRRIGLLHLGHSSGSTAQVRRTRAAQRLVAILLSLNNKALFWLWYSFFFCLSPLRYLDIVLRKHPMAHTIAATASLVGRKPLGADDSTVG